MDSKKNKTMITGIQLVEHLYSQGYCVEEQREFGIKDIGRSIKKLIPKIKNKIDETYANSPLGKWEINKRRGSIRKSLSKRNRLMKEMIVNLYSKIVKLNLNFLINLRIIKTFLLQKKLLIMEILMYQLQRRKETL